MVLGLVAAGGMAWLRSEAGNSWLAERLAAAVTGTMGEGSLEVGGVRTKVFDRVVLQDLRLLDGQGRPVIVAPRAVVELSWSKLLQGTLAIERVLLADPELDLQVDADGALDLSRMFPSDPDAPPPSPLPFRVEIWDLRVDGGSLSYDPGGQAQAWAVDSLSLQSSARGEAWTWTLPDLSGAGVLTEPDAGTATLSGGLRYDTRGQLDLSEVRVDLAGTDLRVAGEITDLDSEPVLDLQVLVETDLDALEVLSGDLTLHGELRVLAQLQGPLDELAVTGRLEQGEGSAEVDMLLDVLDPKIAYSGKIQMQDLDLGAIVDAVTETTVLTGSAEIQGRGVVWPDGVDARGVVDLQDSTGWGYALPGVHSSFTLQDGQIRTRDLLYESWWGRVEGKGRMSESDMDMDIVATVWDARGLEEFQAPGLSGSAKLKGRLRADWSVPDNVTVDLVGQLSGNNLGYLDYVQVGTYTGPLSVWVDATGTRVQASDAQLTELDASSVLVAATGGEWRASVAADGAVEFWADLDGAVLSTWELHADAFSGMVEGSVSADGVTQVVAELGLTSPGLERFVSERGSARISMDGDLIAVDLHCSTQGTQDCAMVGGGDLASGAFRFSVFELGGVDGVVWKNQGPVRFDLTPSYGGATDMDIHMHSVAGDLDVVGDLDTEGALAAQVGLSRVMLAYLSSLFPEELGPMSGMAELTLSLDGMASRPELQGRATVQGLYVPEQVWGMNGWLELSNQGEQLSLRGSVADSKGEVVAMRAELPINLDLSAPAPVLQAPLHAELVAQATRLGRWQDLLPALPEMPGGRVSGLAVVGGSFLEPTLNTQLGLEVAAGDPKEFVRLDSDLIMDSQGALEISGGGHNRGERLLDMGGRAKLDLAAFTQWVFLEGPEPDMEHPERWLTGLSVSLVPLRVHTDTIRAFAELPENFEGRVTGALAIYGDLREPQVSGALQLTEGLVGGLPLEPAVVSLSPDAGGYRISGLFGFREDRDTLHNFQLGGFVPFSLGTSSDWDADLQLARPGLDLDITGDGLPMAILSVADPGITDTYGLLDIQGKIRGSLSLPEPALTLDIEDGGFSYLQGNTRFRDIRLNAAAKGGSFVIEQLRFYSAAIGTKERGEDRSWLPGTELVAGVLDSESVACVRELGLEEGTTTLSGSASLQGLELGELSFDLCGNQAVYSATEEALLKVSSELVLAGPWPDLTVRGDMRADQVDMRFAEDLFFDTVGLELDPRIELVRSQEIAAQVPPDPEFYDPWDIQIHIDLNRAARLDVVVPLFDGYDEALKLSEVRLKNAVLDGELDYRQLGSDYGALGEVDVVRGQMELINKAFRLERGRIVFGGDEIENPAIDFRAVRREGSYGEISVEVGQTVDNPSLVFGSDSGYSNTDILTILLLGMPTSEMGSEGGSTALALASTQLSGVLTEQLESSAQTRLFDSLQVNASAEQAVDNFVIGKSLGPRLYLEYQKNLLPDENESSSEVTAEFVLTRKLALEASLDTDTSMDLFYKVRF